MSFETVIWLLFLGAVAGGVAGASDLFGGPAGSPEWAVVPTGVAALGPA